MDNLKQWMELGNGLLVSLNKTKSHLMAAVDDLVEEGTLNQSQAEAILESWKKKTSSDSAAEMHSEPQQSSTSGESSTAGTSEISNLLEKISKVAPVRREEFDQLLQRVEQLESELHNLDRR